MAAVLGMRGTGDWGTDERPKNFREMILWRSPNGAAPLTALTARMRKQTVDDPEFAWWEEELNPIRLLVTTAVTSTQTTIAIDSGDAQDLVIGDILLVEKTEDTSYSNELVQVLTITSATAFTVTRGVAGSTTGTIADNSYLTKIGNAFEEGSDAPSSSTRNPTKFSNYTQIFKTAYRITNTAKSTHARTGDPLKNDKKRKMFDQSTAMELGFFFGKKYEDTTGTKPKRYTGGLMYFLAQAYAAGATNTIRIWTTTPTEDELLDAVYKCWDYDVEGAGQERLVFAGNGFLNSLNKLARSSTSSRVNFDGVVKVYGMNLQRWILPQGVLYVRTHPLMNVHGRYTNSAFVINPTGIIYRPLVGRDVKPDENGGRGIQSPSADEFKGQWIGEVGIEFHHLKTMCYLGNFVK